MNLVEFTSMESKEKNDNDLVIMEAEVNTKSYIIFNIMFVVNFEIHLPTYVYEFEFNHASHRDHNWTCIRT